MRVISKRTCTATQWLGEFPIELKDGGTAHPGDWIVYTEQRPGSDDGYCNTYTPERFYEGFEQYNDN